MFLIDNGCTSGIRSRPMAIDKKEPWVESPDIKNIYFYGEGVSSLLETIKLATIRKSAPKYEGLKPGQIIHARCLDLIKPMPLTVWGVLEGVPFGEIDPAVLALDGFFDLITAVKEMRTYQGYEDTDLDTPMTAIATIHPDKLARLTPDQQKALFAQAHGKSLSEVIRTPILVPFFRPIIEKWFDIRKEIFLKDQGFLLG